jgi:hypothetical protein
LSNEVSHKIKFTKQSKPMGSGDRDDRGSVEAHLRAEAHAKDMRRFNQRMKELDAEDAQRRGGFVAKDMRFFSSKPGHANG